MASPIDDPNHEPTGGEGASPRPVVVVQYRRGWLSSLTTPLLVLIAAGAILSHRIKIADWRGVSIVLGGAKAKDGAQAAPAPDPALAAAPKPLTNVELKVVPAAAPAPVAASPPEPPAPELSRPTPAALATRPPAIDPEGDSRAVAARAWEEIRRGAEASHAQAAALEEVKEQKYVEDSRTEAIRRAEEARRRERAARDDRLVFRDALRRALGASDRPCSAVRALCQDRGITLGVERRGLGTAAAPALTLSGRRDHVEKLRLRGTDEAAILNDLVRLESRNRAARAGPRSPEDAILRAAWQLLDVPVTPRVR